MKIIMYVCTSIVIVDLYAIQMVSVMSCANIYENNNFMIQKITYFGTLMIIGSLKCLYDFIVCCCWVSFGARDERVISATLSN